MFFGRELSAQPPAPKSPDKKMIIKSSHSVQWSTKCDAERLRALQSDAQRLQITLSAYQPPAGASALLVRLVTADGKSHEIDRFSVHPNVAFKASATTEPQRFSISLAEHAALISDGELRVEVGFDSTQADVRGGMAELSFELVELKSKSPAN